jgi:bifunctional DNA-binding transcriptional regulator/antitoxin component of YhaV-PrlF toxin-antitoxin module
MRSLHISKGGQISVPAEIRRRWGAAELLIEDRGDAVVLRPMPDDPIAGARGALGPARVSSDAARAEQRALEAERERTRLPRDRS